jgi:mono/diheme cytochrome c family protein
MLPLALSILLLAASCSSKSASTDARPLTASEEHGEKLYKSSCAACHHADSTDPLNGPGIKGIFKKKFLPSGAPANDERVHEVIVRGRRNMPPFGQIYDESQIRDIIAYLHRL